MKLLLKLLHKSLTLQINKIDREITRDEITLKNYYLRVDNFTQKVIKDTSSNTLLYLMNNFSDFIYTKVRRYHGRYVFRLDSRLELLELKEQFKEFLLKNILQLYYNNKIDFVLNTKEVTAIKNLAKNKPLIVELCVKKNFIYYLYSQEYNSYSIKAKKIFLKLYSNPTIAFNEELLNKVLHNFPLNDFHQIKQNYGLLSRLKIYFFKRV